MHAGFRFEAERFYANHWQETGLCCAVLDGNIGFGRSNLGSTSFF
jgi:hypothetical protein